MASFSMVTILDCYIQLQKKNADLFFLPMTFGQNGCWWIVSIKMPHNIHQNPLLTNWS